MNKGNAAPPSASTSASTSASASASASAPAPTPKAQADAGSGSSKFQKMKEENKKLKQLVKLARSRIEAQEEELKSAKARSLAGGAEEDDSKHVVTKVLLRTTVEGDSSVSRSNHLYSQASGHDKSKSKSKSKLAHKEQQLEQHVLLEFLPDVEDDDFGESEHKAKREWLAFDTEESFKDYLDKNSRMGEELLFLLPPPDCFTTATTQPTQPNPPPFAHSLPRCFTFAQVAASPLQCHLLALAKRIPRP